jgi:hypothetical protein
MCETFNSEVAMDGYKLRRYGETREYICSKPQAIFLRHVVAGKVPFNKLIGAFEKCTNSLDSRAVDDSAVRTIAHHGSTKPQDGFPFAQHPDFPRISVKSLLSKDIRKKQDTELILLTFIFQRVNRVLCTGVGVVIVYLQYCVGGTWLKCIK